MISPPFAAPKGFISALSPQNEAGEYWFIFSGDQLLVEKDAKSIPIDSCLSLKRKIYMGTLGGKHLFAGEAEEEKSSDSWIWSNLRNLYGVISDEHYALAGRAMQLIQWDRMPT